MERGEHSWALVLTIVVQEKNTRYIGFSELRLTGILSFLMIINPRNTLDVDNTAQYGDGLVLDLQVTISKLDGNDQWRTCYLS